MNTYYIYLSLLLLIFILVFTAISYCLNHAPIKIRVLLLGIFTFLSLRYAALIMLLIIKNIKYLYLLKPLIFLNFMGMPMLAVISTYILARSDKFKFNYCLVICVILTVLYIIAVVRFPVNIMSLGSLGYSMCFINKDIIFGYYLIINTVFLFQAIVLLGHKNANKLGLWLVISAAFVAIIEILARYMNIDFIPSCLFGDILWLATSIYALNKLKK